MRGRMRSYSERTSTVCTETMEMTSSTVTMVTSRKRQKCCNLGCFAEKADVLLVILSLMFLAIGIGAIVGGSKLDTEVDKHHYISDLLELVEFDKLNLVQIQYRLVASINVLGAWSIVTSVVGTVSAHLARRKLFLLFMFTLTVGIILQVVLISYWVLLISNTNDDLSDHFKDLLRQYSFSIDTYSLGWDYVFIYFECCGVEPVTSSHNDFQDLPSYWWQSWLRGSDVIPRSCCKGVSIYTYLFYYNNDCTKYLVPSDYNTEGCYEYFNKMFKQIAKIALIILAGTFALELIAMVLTVIVLVALAANKGFKPTIKTCLSKCGRSCKQCCVDD